MALKGPIAETFEGQARACARMGSPLTAAVCRAAVSLLDGSTATGRRIADWPGDAAADALALRLAGGLHALVRAGRAPELAPIYARAAEDPAAMPEEGTPALRTALAALLVREDAAIHAGLDSPPQTNEVARSAVLAGGLAHLVAETSLPVELMEIGASAGINLFCGRWRIETGQGRRGPESAPVTIPSAWSGTLPPELWPEIIARAGCDRAPLDAGSPEDRARLLSYIWPDQPARLARTEAALATVAAAGFVPDLADAADWAEDRLARPRTEGTARVLAHTVFWQYLGRTTQDRIAAAIAAAGAQATATTPFAHLSLEIDPDGPAAAVTLTLWPGGQRRKLANADFHARWVEWL